MSAELLGLRALGNGFTWGPGMLTSRGERLLESCGRLCVDSLVERRNLNSYEPGLYEFEAFDTGGNVYPDFSDAATFGCLEAQVRALYGDDVYLAPIGDPEKGLAWALYHEGRPIVGPHEMDLPVAARAETLVVALWYAFEAKLALRAKSEVSGG